MSQVAPFASIRSSQTEPGTKQKSCTDDIPMTPPPVPNFPRSIPFLPVPFSIQNSWSSKGNGSASSWGRAAGYGRDRGHRRVRVMEEVMDATTYLSCRPTPNLNPRRRRSTCAGWGSSSSSSNSVSSWACAVGYGRYCACRQVGATEEVVAAVGLGLWKRSRLLQLASDAAPLPI
jgi:hypothetical protein